MKTAYVPGALGVIFKKVFPNSGHNDLLNLLLRIVVFGLIRRCVVHFEEAS